MRVFLPPQGFSHGVQGLQSPGSQSTGQQSSLQDCCSSRQPHSHSSSGGVLIFLTRFCDPPPQLTVHGLQSSQSLMSQSGLQGQIFEQGCDSGSLQSPPHSASFVTTYVRVMCPFPPFTSQSASHADHSDQSPSQSTLQHGHTPGGAGGSTCCSSSDSQVPCRVRFAARAYSRWGRGVHVLLFLRLTGSLPSTLCSFIIPAFRLAHPVRPVTQVAGCRRCRRRCR